MKRYYIALTLMLIGVELIIMGFIERHQNNKELVKEELKNDKVVEKKETPVVDEVQTHYHKPESNVVDVLNQMEDLEMDIESTDYIPKRNSEDIEKFTPNREVHSTGWGEEFEPYAFLDTKDIQSFTEGVAYNAYGGKFSSGISPLYTLNQYGLTKEDLQIHLVNGEIDSNNLHPGEVCGPSSVSIALSNLYNKLILVGDCVINLKDIGGISTGVGTYHKPFGESIKRTLEQNGLKGTITWYRQGVIPRNVLLDLRKGKAAVIVAVGRTSSKNISDRIQSKMIWGNNSGHLLTVRDYDSDSDFMAFNDTAYVKNNHLWVSREFTNFKNFWVIKEVDSDE